MGKFKVGDKVLWEYFNKQVLTTIKNIGWAGRLYIDDLILKPSFSFQGKGVDGTAGYIRKVTDTNTGIDAENRFGKEISRMKDTRCEKISISIPVPNNELNIEDKVMRLYRYLREKDGWVKGVSFKIFDKIANDDDSELVHTWYKCKPVIFHKKEIIKIFRYAFNESPRHGSGSLSAHEWPLTDYVECVHEAFLEKAMIKAEKELVKEDRKKQHHKEEKRVTDYLTEILRATNDR